MVKDRQVDFGRRRILIPLNINQQSTTVQTLKPNLHLVFIHRHTHANTEGSVHNSLLRIVRIVMAFSRHKATVQGSSLIAPSISHHF